MDVLASLLRLLGVTMLFASIWLVVFGRSDHGVLKLAMAGAALLVVSSIGLVLASVAPVAARLDEPLALLVFDYSLETRAGRLFLIPALLGVIAAALLGAALAAQARLAAVWPLGLCALLLFFVPLTMAATSHAASTAWGLWAVAVQAVHIAAALAWAGLVVAVLLPGASQTNSFVMRLQCASNPALGLVLVLVASGVLAAWFHGVRFASLVSIDYGVLILIKSGLLLLALGAAASNRFWGLALVRTGKARRARLYYVLCFEATVLLLVLLAASILARSMPPH